ncbi:MAG: endolytic transglycosylase MltG [Bacteroidota bacterium]|nr:endolytic transglycosylase MltG [Bacteroidota bacterium]
MKIKSKFLKLSIIILLVCFSVSAYFVYQIFYGPSTSLKHTKYVYLEYNDNIQSLENILIEECGLKHPYLFKQLAHRMNLSKWMKQGRYTIEPKMTLVELLKTFRQGKLKTVNITIKPLSTLDKFTEMCGNKLEPDDTAFMNVMNNSVLLDSLGFNKATIYALLLPDTYNFYWHTSPVELIHRLLKEYKLYWDSSKLKQCESIGLNPIEVTTLASIVSKETNKYDEMPMVAGMYVNRLKINMPLQADPTVKFALNQPNLRRILNVHLQVESPYNTYLNVGLPPGPICIASKQSLEAVLNYHPSDFLFMCAKEDFSGYHAFAKDYTTHLKNAKRYQQALNVKNIR